MSNDINALDLTQLTEFDGSEQFVMFDTTEGKRASVSTLSTYIGTPLNEALSEINSKTGGSTATDANIVTSGVFSVQLYNGHTLNTPYKAGLTGGSAGALITYANSQNYGIQLCAVSGGVLVFVRKLHSGTWGSWETFQHENLYTAIANETTVEGALNAINTKIGRLRSTTVSDLNIDKTDQFNVDKWGATTANTPYTEGLTNGNPGISITYASSENSAVQFASPVGKNELFIRKKASGTWGSWEKFQHENLYTAIAGETTVEGALSALNSKMKSKSISGTTDTTGDIQILDGANHLPLAFNKTSPTNMAFAYCFLQSYSGNEWFIKILSDGNASNVGNQAISGTLYYWDV